ncbi:MAG: LysR family transcriptional regulator [Candidatus Methanoplasma sp.]|nr:LysR family transcriptional regulator [Candidatus Methanoplasma sp.]
MTVELSVRTEQVINGKLITNRQLETLAAVAKAGSKTAAAKKLGISVPVVHRYIAAIEEAVGSPITISTPAGTKLNEEGMRILETYVTTELRCSDDHNFTVCCSPVTEDLMMSVLSALKMTDVELVVSDDLHNIRMMRENLADFAIIDDPLYLFDAEEFEGTEIGYMGMVFVDNGPSFIRYRYGAQRVAFMFLDTMGRKYTIDSETFSLPELIGSKKSYFVDEFLLLRKGIKMKSAIDPKVLKHAITAIYRREDKTVARLIRALKARNIK